MPKYEIKAPTGLAVTIEAERAPTQDEALEFFRNRTEDALTNLATYERRMITEGEGRGRKTKPEPQMDFITREVPRALSIPAENFNPKEGAPSGIRSDLSFLHDLSDQLGVLEHEYGPENVSAININGKPNLLYRDPDANEWRFVDGKSRFEVEDYTSDLVGSLVPTTASVAAGVAATPLGPKGIAASAAAGNFVFGTLQDIFLTDQIRQEYGLDAPEILNVVRRRGAESVISGTIDLATMRAGKLLPGFLGGKDKRGSDVATFEIMNLDKSVRGETPNFLLRGEVSVSRAQDLASRYPNSSVATLFSDIRTRAGKFTEGAVGIRGETIDQSERTLRSGFATTTQQLQDDVTKLENSLSSLAERRTAAEARTAGQSPAQVRREAQKTFEAESRRILGDLRSPGEFSPEQTGKFLQRSVALDYARAEVQKDELFNAAYRQLDDQFTYAGELSERLSKISDEGIVNLDGELISAINPTARTASGRAAQSLSEISDQTISFKQLNESIQYFEGKLPKRSGATLSPDQRIYQNVANELRRERDRLLQQAPESARNSFNAANDYYRNTILKYRDSRFFKEIEPKINSTWRETKESLRQGNQNPELPNFNLGGNEILTKGIRNSETAQELLDLTNNNPEVRKALRNAWLNKKGIIAGQPISKRSLSFSAADMDMAKVLWPSAKKGGVSPIVERLRRLQNHVAREEEFVDGITEDTLKRIVGPGSDQAQRELDDIARQEVATKAELQKLKEKTIWQLYSKGALPLPDNEITMQTMVDGLITSKGLDVRTLSNLVGEVSATSPAMRRSFENAVMYDLLRRAGQGTDEGQLGRFGYQLWNADRMQNLLDNYNDRLVTVFGKDKVTVLREMNTALRRFSVKRGDEATGVRTGTALSGAGRMSLFFSNIQNFAKDRINLAAMNLAMKMPSLQKTLVDPASFDDAMARVYQTLFVSAEGLQMLQMQADADPRFKEWMHRNYADVFDNSTANMPQ